MFYYFNSLNLKQIGGGNQVKQGDFGSTFTYELADEKGYGLNTFDQKTAYVNLELDNDIVFTTTAIVDGSTVSFKIDKAIPIGLYFLEIKIDNYIFPSDRKTIILVTAGAVAYDLKELVPNYDTNMTISSILSDLSQKGIDISDLKTKMSAIYNNALADHAEVTKARGTELTLNDRLGKMDDINKSLTEQMADKATKAELSAIATPKAVTLAGQMTDITKIYVYTGAEDGYTAGNWYYHNGTVWVSGGVYQASGIADKSVTQNTLSSNLSDAVFQEREFEWVVGTILTSSGVNTENLYRIRTKDYVDDAVTITFDPDNTIATTTYNIFTYTLEGVYLSTTGWISNKYYELPSGYRYRFALKISDTALIDESNIKDLIDRLKIHTPNVSQLKVDIDEINNKLEPGIPISDWELGSISSTTGVDLQRVDRIRTKKPKYFPIGTRFKLTDAALRLGFYFYEADGTPIEGTGLTNDMNSYTLNSDSYLRVLLAYDDNRDMSSTIIENAMSVTVEPTLNYLYSKVSELSGDKILPFPEFVFDIPYTVGYVADHCFVRDELWIFESTADDVHSAYANVKRYTIDLENKTGSYIGGFTHNWGHVNSIDYCEETDTLICGNGSGQYTTGNGEIYLIPNAYALKNLSTAPFETYAQIIDVHTVADWGYKHNVVWGESNDKQFNICYVITNDNKNVRKVLLGQGTNNLGSGNFVEGKTGLEFNGTYKVIKSYSQSDGLDVLQGATYYNGKLFGMLGHGKYWLTVSQLNEDGSISRKQYIDRIFDALGSEITSRYTSGVDFKNNYLITCTTAGKIKFYKSIW